jgi:DnaJ family protein A protein 2
VLKVPGEGMPTKRGEIKGDLYLIAKVDFPEDGWLKDDKEYEALQKLLPPPAAPIIADEVDEVTYEEDVDIEEVSCIQWVRV